MVNDLNGTSFGLILFNKVIWLKHVHDVASLSSVETF